MAATPSRSLDLVVLSRLSGTHQITGLHNFLSMGRLNFALLDLFLLLAASICWVGDLLCCCLLTQKQDTSLTMRDMANTYGFFPFSSHIYEVDMFTLAITKKKKRNGCKNPAEAEEMEENVPNLYLQSHQHHRIYNHHHKPQRSQDSPARHLSQHCKILFVICGSNVTFTAAF